MALVHHTQWKKGKAYNPSLLVLDPENYRLDQSGRQLSQAQIIEQLVEQEDVKDIASQIVNKGYMPVEDVVIIEENSRRIVIEGNRRTTALQLLANPKKAPLRHRSFFQRLKDQAGDQLPKKIYVAIAPNRAEAQVYVYTKHTDEGFTKRWQGVRSAAFVVDQLSKGSTVEDLSRQTGLTRGKIIERITALDLYRLAGAMELPTAVATKLRSASTFPYEALAGRIFGNGKIREILGVKLTENGIQGTAGSRDEFLGALKKIFVDVSGDAATRKYGKAKDAERIIRSMGYQATGSTKWKAYQSPETPSTTPESTQNVSKNQSTRSRKEGKDKLLPSDLKVEIGGDKLSDMIDEAKKIVLADYFHSGGVFLRCIFEIAINRAVDEHGCRKALKSRYSKKLREGELPIGVLLGDLKRSDALLKLDLEKSELRTLDLLAGDGYLSYDHFNLFAHNADWPATFDQVKALRDRILPLLRKALLNPNQ